MCETLGLRPGGLSCRADCRGYVTVGCGALETCGDGVIEGEEACDGVALGGATCSSMAVLLLGYVRPGTRPRRAVPSSPGRSPKTRNGLPARGTRQNS